MGTNNMVEKCCFGVSATNIIGRSIRGDSTDGQLFLHQDKK